MEKICTKCNISKSLDEFYKSPKKYNSCGYKPECKVCANSRQKSSYTGEYHKNRLENLDKEKYQKRSQQLTINARKRRKDPLVKIKESVRTRLYNGLKRYQIKKSNSTVDYLGCDMKSYHSFLEQQFDSNMSWDNYGIYWEIDHIKPIDSFDLSNPQQLYECFHYLNTRPLNITLNKIKSNKIV